MTMIPTNLTEIKIQFIKIAKKQNISMTRTNERIIEFVEKDKLKAIEFVKTIKNISPSTKVIELIATDQVTDTRGNDISNDKALYLVDDNYYKKLIGADADKQLSLF